MTGLLGTLAPLSSDLSLISQVLMVVILGVSITRARSKEFIQHGYMILVGMTVKTLTVLMVMLPVARSLVRWGPGVGFISLVWGHITTGVLVLLGGYYLLWVWGLKQPVECLKHKRVMRIVALLWVLDVALGASIYFKLYV